MPKPLRLFITPPYSGTPDNTWQLVHGYGFETTAPGAPFHSFAVFRTPGTGTVRAAGDGVLSSTPPAWWRSDPRDPLTLDAATDPLAERANIYLQLTPRVTSEAAFHARSSAIDGLTGFAYFDVDPSSLETILGPLLEGPFFGGAMTRAQAVEQFLRGELQISVTAGTAIAQAAVSTSSGAPAGTREIGFAAVIAGGFIDPSYAYDWMRDFVEDSQPQVDLFLALSPTRWPIFDPTISTEAGIALTNTRTFPWSVLEQFRAAHELTAAEWRTVGNNQKRIYRERLLTRAGRPSTGSTEPPFELNDQDTANVFQLEAVAEFYANFNDPWSTTATPRPPDGANYTVVDFLDPEGLSATVSGRTVTLEGSPSLARVRKKDTIFLEADTKRQTRTYAIVSINGSTLTLDAEPDVEGATAWRINVKPVIVIIDAAGTRERSGSSLLGTGASVSAPGVVQLDGTVGLGRINARRTAPAGAPTGTWNSGPFDTIYFPSDQAAAVPGRPARTYRILSVNAAARTVTVDGTPDFGGTTSRWHIPAGVSGTLPPFQYNIGPHKPEDGVTSAKGTDHYDGIVFVVDAGRVVGTTRMSSYTSRIWPDSDSESLSSIRGNRRFNIRSFLSSSEFKNYSFRVEDFGAIPPNGGEAATGQDTVSEARHYFDEAVTADSNGKGLIRLHLGTRNGSNSGSKGCLVSPVFYQLRDFLIRRHLADFAAANPGAQLPHYSILEGASHDKSTKLYNNSVSLPAGSAPLDGNHLARGQWDNLLVASLWLIRPDERPIG
ncbi:MAG TPA: hypothetical protein VFT22_39700 [Kofleriaceae bacterium]|nr:hypothetical protein [Kofleriaceae bacterium]